MQIEKAQMRIKILLPKECAKRAREKLLPSISHIESEDWDCGQLEMVSTLMPKIICVSLIVKKTSSL